MNEVQSPLVSVCVPIYNAGQYLTRCVTSIITQTYKNLEIVLVDDGSTDDSGSMADAFEKIDCRIKVVHQANKGVGAARNTCLDNANGEYICWMDADDWADPDYVKSMLYTALETNARVVQCRKITVTDEISVIQPTLRIKIMDWRDFSIFLDVDDPTRQPRGSIYCNLYHKSLFENIRFVTNYISADDMIITAELMYAARNYPFAIINQTLYYYYIANSSLTRCARTIKDFDRWKGSAHSQRFWDSLSEPEIADIRFKIHFSNVIDCYFQQSLYTPECVQELRLCYEEIERCIDRARELCVNELQINAGSEFAAKRIINSKKTYIYGAGNLTKTVTLPWLNFLNVEISGIIDRDPKETEINGVTIYKSDTVDVPKNALVLVSVLDELIGVQIRRNLRELGYSNIMSWESCDAAMKYLKLRKLVPCALPQAFEILY